MKGLFRRGEHGLVPLDDELPGWKRIKPGDIIEVEYVRPRSQKFHRLFFVLVKIVADNQEKYGFEQMREIITMGAGHATVFEIPNSVGLFVRKAKSIKWHLMDDDAFMEFFRSAVDYIISDMIPFDREALLREVYDLAGLPQSII